jgi:hypothetical protein
VISYGFDDSRTESLVNSDESEDSSSDVPGDEGSTCMQELSPRNGDRPREIPTSPTLSEPPLLDSANLDSDMAAATNEPIDNTRACQDTGSISVSTIAFIFQDLY